MKLHFPLTPISEIYRTKRDTVKVSMVNQAKVVNQLIGFTELLLRNQDYEAIGYRWEDIMIATYTQMQEEQFRKQYGDEY